MICGFIFLRLFRRFQFIRVPLLYVSVMGVSVFMFLMLTFPEEMFGLIGKDPSFTGRTDIWELLITSIREKFWFGHGYGIYWMDPLGPSYYVRAKLEWGVPTAHNGWIESWLSAGLVIIVLFGFQYLLTLLFAINRLKKGGVETYWAILSTLMFLFFSMSESTILAQNDISWLLFVATAAKLFAFERPYWRDRPSHPYHRPMH
jgi:O-antigen ligase